MLSSPEPQVSDQVCTRGAAAVRHGRRPSPFPWRCPPLCAIRDAFSRGRAELARNASSGSLGQSRLFSEQERSRARTPSCSRLLRSALSQTTPPCVAPARIANRHPQIHARARPTPPRSALSISTYPSPGLPPPWVKVARLRGFGQATIEACGRLRAKYRRICRAVAFTGRLFRDSTRSHAAQSDSQP